MQGPYMISLVPCKDHIWFPWFHARIIYEFLGSIRESYMISLVPCKDHKWFPSFHARVIYGLLGSMRGSYMISLAPWKDHIWFPWFHAWIVLENTLWFVWHHIWSLYGTKEAATRDFTSHQCLRNELRTCTPEIWAKISSCWLPYQWLLSSWKIFAVPKTRSVHKKTHLGLMDTTAVFIQNCVWCAM